MSHEIYIFGSITRGEVNSTSDTDVLVIPFNGQSKNCFPSSWSFYTKEILSRMHSEGRLFSWHLYLDAKCVHTFRGVSLLAAMGEPNSYETAVGDIKELRFLLEQSIKCLAENTPSKIYEIGIIHTCMRDIAMAASWSLNKRPCFSIDAPYKIGVPFPMDIDTFTRAASARHQSTRGIINDAYDWDGIAEEILAIPIIRWISEVQERVYELVS